MDQVQLPKDVSRIASDENFCFSCHPEVRCFTDCCRQLELALTPYDVLRLKLVTELDSSRFLNHYVIREQEPEDAFPRFYLTMIDDGQASCVFVAKTGCTVYSGRPGACRTYPMGRAAIRQADHSFSEFFVLLREPHCKGFEEKENQNAPKYCKNQGLEEYYRFNDKVATLLQHDAIRAGMQLSHSQTEYFVLALYDLDRFRSLLNNNKLPHQQDYSGCKDACRDDKKLLIFGIQWLQNILFKEPAKA